MAERAINQKKAQFLKTFAPVSASLDELIREKLECGKFPLTKTGWSKIVATIVCLAGLALFFAQDWDVCDTPNWYSVVFPACVGANALVQIVFYMIFSCGLVVKYPGKWVTADIITNLLFAVIGIVGSLMTTVAKLTCTENETLHQIPGPIGIVGGVCTIIGCAAIFLMYRYVEDEDEEIEPPQTPMERNIDLRKSMHA